MNLKALLLLAVLFASFACIAQKIGYVDTDVIVNKMPAYAKAQAELEKYSIKSQKEIEALYFELAQMEKDYQAKEILLTDELKRDMQKAITDKRQEVQDKMNKLFGYEGGLFLKKKELIKPLMDEIARALDKVTQERKLDFIFDKAADLSMIYTNPRHDYTDYVLEELGLGDKEDNPTNK